MTYHNNMTTEETKELKLNTIDEATELFRKWGFVIVVDDESCENEGTLHFSCREHHRGEGQLHDERGQGCAMHACHWRAMQAAGAHYAG